MSVGAITAKELQARLQRGEVALVDVREPWEYDLARIPGAVLIPLRELPERLDELPRDRDVVFQCHLGVRSYHAALVADSSGIRALNLTGGIAAWSRDVDPSVPDY